MNVGELLAALRALEGSDLTPNERGLYVLIKYTEFARASAPEIAAEGLDAHLDEYIEDLWDEHKQSLTFFDSGGNVSGLAAEYPMITASAAVLRLMELKPKMTQTAAIKLVAEACPSDVRVGKVKNWMMPSKQMTPERQRQRVMSLEAMRRSGQREAGLLHQVRAAFERLSKVPF